MTNNFLFLNINYIPTLLQPYRRLFLKTLYMVYIIIIGSKAKCSCSRVHVPLRLPRPLFTYLVCPLSSECTTDDTQKPIAAAQEWTLDLSTYVALVTSHRADSQLHTTLWRAACFCSQRWFVHFFWCSVHGSRGSALFAREYVYGNSMVCNERARPRASKTWCFSRHRLWWKNAEMRRRFN